MGHAIERIALDRGHEVVARIDIHNRCDLDSEAFRSADVVIEFTRPDTAYNNIMECFARGKKVVSGTTGWQDRFAEVAAMCKDGANTLFWSSNFSIGVNLFMAINRYVARLMSRFPQYAASMTEVHHVHKLDHPSGTAITLAEGLIEEAPQYTRWAEEPAGDDALIVSHVRQSEVPGTHTITWDSPVDTVTIEHRAKSRDGFALGAVLAAEFTAARTGLLSMDMLLNL